MDEILGSLPSFSALRCTTLGQFHVGKMCADFLDTIQGAEYRLTSVFCSMSRERPHGCLCT